MPFGSGGRRRAPVSVHGRQPASVDVVTVSDTVRSPNATRAAAQTFARPALHAHSPPDPVARAAVLKGVELFLPFLGPSCT